MKIPKRIASAIINSLKGGVVPANRAAIHHRRAEKDEIDAFLNDIDIIGDGRRVFPLYCGQIRQRQELSAPDRAQLC